MPVTCTVDIERLSTEDFSDLDYVVMGHAFKCHNQFGRLADEQIYEANLADRLNDVRAASLQQVPLLILHETFRKKLFLDLVVSRKGVYEVKTVASLTKEHVAQLLTYLYLLDLPRGKLINFRSPKVESHFVNAPCSRQTRTSFAIDKTHYHGCTELLDMTVNLLRDLGTALSVSLYQEVLVDLLGGEDFAIAKLPIKDGQRHIGNQRFHLATPTEALRVTCFSRIPSDYECQLHSLLKFSPLVAMQWINIDTNKVTFNTITKS